MRLVLVHTGKKTAYLATDSGCLIIDEDRLKAFDKYNLTIDNLKSCIIRTEEIGPKIVQIGARAAIAYTAWSFDEIEFQYRMRRFNPQKPEDFLTMFPNMCFFLVRHDGRSLKTWDINETVEGRSVTRLFNTRYKTVCYAFGVPGGEIIESTLQELLHEHTPTFYFEDDSEIKKALLEVYENLKVACPILGRNLHVLKVSNEGCHYI